MSLRKAIKAVIGLVGLVVIYMMINTIDLIVVYSIFISFQFLLVPFFTSMGYLAYVARMCFPYFLIYIFICLLLHLFD